jgi:predicted nuclease of restriction endonuclease-like (RecB) superfamily
MKKNKQLQSKSPENKFFSDIASIVDSSRRMVGRTVNLLMCITYFEIGRKIITEEQCGADRARYGEKTLSELSKFLTERFGRGFSVTTLKNARFFFIVYGHKVPLIESTANSSEIGQKLSAQFDDTEDRTSVDKSDIVIGQKLSDLFMIYQYPFKLSWSHYVILMRIQDEAERSFYEIEAYNNQWTYHQLQRQFHSSLYERLALSRDKDGVKKLSNEGQVVEKPTDILKNPLVLEYLGLKEETKYSETELETAIIDKLADFILEMGKGFLFEARQKRFTFDEDHFMVDLVFYNRLLQCYVLIDLKTEKNKTSRFGTDADVCELF